jgi:hypothetical protein
MNLDDRITDIVESGQNAARSKTYQLLSDAVSAISHHTGIPVGELLNFVKDELK